MKRKLDSNDEPTVVVSTTPAQLEQSRPETTFESFSLDPRILQAIAKSHYFEPTPVQSQAIPLALAGRDILAKSKTGSGKTAAYAIPAIQSVLRYKTDKPKDKAVAVLVLVPTRELSDQVTRSFASLAEFCAKEVRALNLTQRVSDSVLSAKLQDLPDVVVSTPGRASQLITNGLLPLNGVRLLVIDEADLVLSYGYEDDMKTISQNLPGAVQTFLVSATLTPDVDQLKALFCRDPVTVKIDEKEDEGEGVVQYVVKCGEEEKFLLIFVIFKLKLVKGRCIIFVADLDRSYRLKLYLEQYGIRSCVLNSELPVNSRLHVVEEFNKGLYDILIAADDQEVLGGVHKRARSLPEDADENGAANEVELTDEDEDVSSAKQNTTKSTARPKDFGVSRGIDFQNVSCVLNFDLPNSSKSYTHRIGRTARARKSGMALSFVIPRDEFNKHKPTSHASCRNDEKVLAKIVARQEKKGNQVRPYKFDMDQVAAFRYRMNDALRAVTKVAVHEARAREIKQELIRSEKLRKHFEDNPEDLRHLRRSDGGALGGGGVVRVQSHLKHVPDYLLPEKGRKKTEIDGQGNDINVGFVSINGDDRNNKKTKFRGKKSRSSFRKGGSAGGRKNDPLKTFRGGGTKRK